MAVNRHQFDVISGMSPLDWFQDGGNGEGCIGHFIHLAALAGGLKISHSPGVPYGRD